MPKLSGSDCANHPAAQGSNRKHTIDVFLYIICMADGKRENKEKRVREWSIF